MLKRLVLACLIVTHLSLCVNAQSTEGEKIFQAAMQEYYQEKYTEAYKLMLQASNKNYPGAYTMLGYMQSNGEGTKSDHNAALKSFEKAIALNDKKAYLLLGHAYNDGDGVAKDESLASTYYVKSMPEVTRAADQGDLFWRVRLAYAHIYGYGVSKNPEAGMSHLKKAADAGYVTAQYRLGIEFLGSKNYPEAMLWLRKASDNGSIKAKFEIGYSYYYGRGVKENNELAFQSFEEASQAGHVDATGYLATMYDNGLYVDKDWNEAFKYYSLYEKLGGGGSYLTSLGEFYVFGINGAKKDLAKARELFTRSGAKISLEILDQIGTDDKIRGSNSDGDVLEVTNSNKEPQVLAKGDTYWREKFEITFKSAEAAKIWPTSAVMKEYETKGPADEIKYSQYSPSEIYSIEKNKGSIFIVYKNSARQIRYMYVVCVLDTSDPITIKVPLAVCWPPN